MTGPAHTTVNLNLTVEGVVRIQFGDNWNVGIDNIKFDQVQTTVIPEPSALALISLGGVGLFSYRWRHRARREERE